MQETRLNLLLTNSLTRITNFFNNPWRKLSLILINLFLGFFLASGIASSITQTAIWDTSFALSLLIFTEVMSMIVYRNSSSSKNNSLWINALNGLRIGFIYGLYLEAIKLNS